MTSDPSDTPRPGEENAPQPPQTPAADAADVEEVSSVGHPAPAGNTPSAQSDQPQASDIPADSSSTEESASPGESAPPAKPKRPLPFKIGSQRDPSQQVSSRVPEDQKALPDAPSKPAPPSRRGRLSSDLQKEFDDMMAGVSLDEMLTGAGEKSAEDEWERDTRLKATVMKRDEEHVFFDLPGRFDGMTPLKNFEEPPAPGDQLDVIVVGYNAEDGLYEVRVPGASVDVEDWADLVEGTVVEARVTGSNAGGLECQVGSIRGFIPASQVALHHVSDFAEYLEQKFPCVVVESNERRRNLVLSRRAVLEREREEARQKLLESLEPGQTIEGVVRKMENFGAFVDLGSGVDGLIHISELSWDRVKHPSEVLHEGQRVKVKINKFDPESGRIGLSYRETLENPWENVEAKYPIGQVFTGTVTRIANFGAFVKLEPGIEGLVHVSELSHKRVIKVENFVQEGQQVQVKVISVDPESQRISLSIKEAQPSLAEEKQQQEAQQQQEEEAPREMAVPPRKGKLKGGTGRKSGGDQFGLNW